MFFNGIPYIYVFLVPIVQRICHSHLEGSFSRHVNTWSRETVTKGSLLTEESVDVFHCANKCLVKPRCKSYFYGMVSKQCVLHGNITEVSAKDISEWVYWYRNTPLKAKKRSVLLMFANYAITSPYIFDLETFNWTTYNKDKIRVLKIGGTSMSYSTGKDGLEYDYQTQTLYWTETTGYMYSMPLRTLEDLNKPNITKVSKKKVYGVSMDSKRRMLFFLRVKSLMSMSLDTRQVKVVGKIRTGKTFGPYCKSAVDVSRRRVFFHRARETKIFWAEENRKIKNQYLKSTIVNLFVDLKGDRLIYMSVKGNEVWSLSLDTLEEKALMRKKPLNMVYPFDDFLLCIGRNGKNVTLRTSDGGNIVRRINPQQQCLEHACIETCVLRLKI